MITKLNKNGITQWILSFASDKYKLRGNKKRVGGVEYFFFGSLSILTLPTNIVFVFQITFPVEVVPNSFQN